MAARLWGGNSAIVASRGGIMRRAYPGIDSVQVAKIVKLLAGIPPPEVQLPIRPHPDSYARNLWALASVVDHPARSAVPPAGACVESDTAGFRPIK